MPQSRTTDIRLPSPPPSKVAQATAPVSTPADLRRTSLNLSPIEVARAFRKKFPGYKPDLDDTSLYHDLRASYPDDIKLLTDPLLEGSELLAPPPSLREKLGRGGEPEALPTPPVTRQASLPERAVAASIRIAPPLGTAAALALTAPPTGGTSLAAAVPLTAATGAAGEHLAQEFERAMGTREDVSLPLIASAGAFSAIPGLPLGRGLTTAGRLAVRGAEGAGLGLVQQEIDRRLEGLPAPSLSERATVGGVGALLGGGFGAVEARGVSRELAEAAEQIRRRTMTRAGLAGTVERVAAEARAMGLDEAASRQYAARAARALYQGRPVPDPPLPKVAQDLESALQAPPTGPRLKRPTGEVVAELPPPPREEIPDVQPPPAVAEGVAPVAPRGEGAGQAPQAAPLLRWVQQALDADRRAPATGVKSAVAEAEGIRSDLLRTGAVRGQPSRQKFVQAIERFLTTGESSPEVEAAQILAQKWHGALDPATGRWRGVSKPTVAGQLERLTLWNEQGPQFVQPQRTPARSVPGLLQEEVPLGVVPPPGREVVAPEPPPPSAEAQAFTPPRPADPTFWVPPPPSRESDLGEVALRARAEGRDVVAEVERARDVQQRAAKFASELPPLYNPPRDEFGAPLVEPPPTQLGQEAEAARVAAEAQAGVVPPPTYTGPERRVGARLGPEARRPAGPGPRHPSRTISVTLGDRGRRTISFPDEFHKDLFAAPGRSRRAMSPEGRTGRAQGTADIYAYENAAKRMGVAYDTPEARRAFGERVDAYRARVMTLARQTPEGGMVEAPRWDALDTPPPGLGPEAGVLRLGPRQPIDFSVPPGDTPALKQWLASRQPAFGKQPWFRRAEQALQSGDPNRAWKLVQAERVRSLPAAEREKLLAFAKARGERSSVRVQYGGDRQRLAIPEPPSAKPRQVGQLAQSRSALLEGIRGLPEEARLPTISHDVVQQILKRTDRAKVAAIAGNTDPAYRVTRQVVHQILSENPKYRAVSAALGMAPDDLARGLQATVTESARILQKMSAFRREAPPIFVEQFDKAIGEEAAGKISGIASEGDAAVKLYGGLFAIDPEEAAKLFSRAIDAYDQAHLQWMLAREPKKLGPFSRFVNFTNATLTGTVEQFWRNGLMGALRWDLGIVEDLAGASFALAYRPSEGRVLFKRAVDRVTALGQLGSAVARPWGDDVVSMWPRVAQGLDGLSPRDFRHTLKWLSEAPEVEAAFLGREAQDLPVNNFESKAVKVLQFWNRLQEYPLRAMATDLSMRTEIRRRGFEPNQVIANDVPLATIFGSEEAAARVLMKAVRDGNDFTFAGNPIRGTWNAGLIDLFKSYPFLTLLNRFSRFGLSAGPRYLWDRTPAALVEPLLAWRMKGRLVHGQTVRRVLDDALPARETRLRDINDKQGRALQQKLALTADRRTLVRKLRSLEAMEEKVAAGQRARLTPNEVASKLAETRNRLRSTTNAINAFEGSLAAINHERQLVLEQKKGLESALTRSSDAAAPESLAELLGRATLGSLMIGAAYQVASLANQQDLPWYQVRFGEPDAAGETVTDIRGYGGMAQWFYMGKILHEFVRHTDPAAFSAARAEGKSVPDAIRAGYSGKYDFGKFVAEGAQALLSMNPTAGAQATLLDFLDPQRLTPEGIADGVMEFVGEIGASALQPLQSYRNIASALDPEEEVVRSPRASEEAPLGELGASIAKIPGASQIIPETISQTSGQPLRSKSAWTRPAFGVTTVQPPNKVERELRSAGVDPQSIYVPNLRATALNQALAMAHSRSLKQVFNRYVFGNRRWEALHTPEERREYLQRFILPAAKQLTKREMLRTFGRQAMRGAAPPSVEDRQNRLRQLVEAWAAGAEMGPSTEQRIDEVTVPPPPPP